ncbi:MAG: hypothetical protein JWM80_6209 [Cyanobacteria bacterium RYN_339]|nr:hypothetical protein [Cyanobacteria bacterium RYN_339]
MIAPLGGDNTSMNRIALLLLVAVLAGCSKSPAAADEPDLQTPRYAPAAPVAAAPAAPSADTRVRDALTSVQKLRDSGSTADCQLMFRYVKDDGTKEWIRSHYKYQKPKRNSVELLTGSDSKVEGTQLIWTGGSKVKVHTKFVGFWLNIELGLEDERLKDPVGYRLDQTSIDKVFDTILCPQNQVTYKADGNLNGRVMAVLDIVSPLSLKPTTREVIGIEKATGVPLIREMYKGDKLFFRMQTETNKLNPKLTTKDFEL